MAWWSSLSNASKLASLAIKEATRRIDQALDIDDDPSLSAPFELIPKNEVHHKTEVIAPEHSSISSATTSACNPQASRILTEDLQMKDPDVTLLSVPNPQLPKVSDLPSFGPVRRQRHASQPVPSSDPMPEVIAYEEAEISNSSAKSLQGVHSCEGSPSVSLSMGDTLTSEMGRSLAFADNSASPVTLTTSTAALATSQPVDSVTDPCSPDFLDNREKVVEGEETQRNQPATNPSSPRPHSPRTQDDAVRSEDHLEDDANTTTTSSEIEVISCCTSVNGEASNGSGNSTAVLLVATDQFLQGTDCPQDLSSRDRSLCHLARPVSGRCSSNPTVANRPSESALHEDLSQLLEARESKILELSRENISLQEANAFLQSTRCAKLEALVAEKETQIAEILQEGERMAQEQLKTNNIIKSLRAKEKANEQKMQRTSSALTRAQTEIERLKAELATAQGSESKSLGALNQVNRQNLKLEKDLAALNNELGLSREKVEHLEKTVQAHEAGKQQMVEKLEETQRHLSAANSRLETMRGSEQQRAALHEEIDRLRNQIDEMRRTASKQQRSLEQAREQSAQEVSYYRSRLANAETQLELMGETASSVAKPLLSRIESLQSSLDDQTAAFEQTEQRLSAQIEDLQAKLSASAQTDRELKQRLIDSEKTIATLRDELKKAKLEKDEVQKQLAESFNQLQDKDKFLQRLQGDILAANRKVSEVRKTFSSLEEENRTEREVSAHLRAELKEARAALQEIVSRKNSVAEGHVQDSPSSPKTSTVSIASVDERSSQRSLSSSETPTSTPAIQPPSASMQFASSLEYLQSTLRQRDGEVSQLRREVVHLKEAREKLMSELSEQTDRANQFARLAGVTGAPTASPSAIPALTHKPSRLGEAAPIGSESDAGLLAELQRRYELLLELYGEKLEESNELKMDLAEAKEAYKLQLTELLANQEKNKG